jgi:iduronate 2-sulfatase
LIAHEDGFLELYDHRLPDAETVNLAGANGPLATLLLAQLEKRLEEAP